MDELLLRLWNLVQKKKNASVASVLTWVQSDEARRLSTVLSSYGCSNSMKYTSTWLKVQCSKKYF